MDLSVFRPYLNQNWSFLGHFFLKDLSGKALRNGMSCILSKKPRHLSTHALNEQSMTSKIVKQHLFGFFLLLVSILWWELLSMSLVSIAYLNDEEIRLASHSAVALAVLLKEHVWEAFELLKENSPWAMKDFFAYLEMQWFTRASPEYWAVSDLNCHTNNFTEGDPFLCIGKLTL